MLRNTTCRGISRHVTDVTCATCQGLYFVHLKNDFSTVQGCYISLHHKDYITTCHGRQSDTCQGSYFFIKKTIWGLFKDVPLHYMSRIISRHVTDFHPETCQGSYVVHSKDYFRTCQGFYITLHLKGYIRTCHGRLPCTCPGLFYEHDKDNLWTCQGFYLSIIFQGWF